MTDIQPYKPDMSGLEDFDQNDMVMPTITLDHANGKFIDGLSKEEFTSLDCVVLGLVKQRVLWPDEVTTEKLPPLCRSLDFQLGRPDVDRFPWQSSGFDPEPEGSTLPCASCQLKEWGTNPRGDTPWCSEQHTYAILYKAADGQDVPAIVMFQRSGIKPSKTYLTSFARSKTPVFTVRTTITLDVNTRGTVKYSVPKFQRGVATDQSEWAGYSENYRNIREFLQTPRQADDDGVTVEGAEEGEVTPVAVSSVPPSAPVAAPAAAAPAAASPAPSAPAPAAPAASAVADDDDLPF